MGSASQRVADFPRVQKLFNLPPPPGEVLDWSYNMRREDFYVQTDQGWYWCDGKHDSYRKEWMLCPYGPVDG